MTVQALLGNIFDGGTDLTVLPCSSKPSVSKATRTWIEAFELKDPLMFDYDLSFGGISQVYPFIHKSKRTKFYVYAAAVLNDYSTPDTVFKISKRLGELTIERSDIKTIECVLLGTGAGGLTNIESITSLATGFEESAEKDARLIVYSWNSQTKKEIEKELTISTPERIAEKIKLTPGIFGIGVDLNSAKMKIAKAISKIKLP